MSLGENLKKYRKIMRVSQQELSNITGIPRASISRYENNERRPNSEIVKEISMALKVNTDTLFFWTDNICTNDDVLMFIENLFPEKYYRQNEKFIYICKITSIEESDIKNMLIFSNSSLDTHRKFAKSFGITEIQLYRWIISIAIYDFLSSYISNLSDTVKDKIIKKIITENILIHQPIDEIIITVENIELYTLSDENKEKIKIYLTELKKDPNYQDFFNERCKDVKVIEDSDSDDTTINLRGFPKEAIEEVRNFLEYVKSKYKI